MREGDHDAVPRADEARQLVLGLRQPARCDRRPLRLERERLPVWQRVELAGARQVELGAFLGEGLADVVRTPDQVGWPVEWRDEVVRNRRRPVVVRKPRLGLVEPALGGRVDNGALDFVQRALSERREGANGLDLIAEELDPERVAAGRREDVDEPATHGELAALLPRLGRRQRLRERGRRRADEPARGKDVQRPRPLADEVRRRLEAGAPLDAAARQQRDALLAEQPARRLGGIAGVRVVREEDDKSPGEALVQRREQQRQYRLRYPRGGGHRLREHVEPLVGEQLLDERMEDGSRGLGQVHDERRNRRFRPPIVAPGGLLEG